MGIVQSIVVTWNSFLNYITKYFQKEDETEEDIEYSEENLEEIETAYQNFKSSIEDDMIVVNKKSMLSKLYSLEQMIKSFEDVFPKQYNDFYDKIKCLKEEYQTSLNEYIEAYDKGNITFEIDPDEDSRKISEVITLENEVKKFIEKDYKYNILLKRVQMLCLKLNILYNTSLLHFSTNEKESVVLQASRASTALLNIIHDLKSSDLILNDKLRRENLLGYISYADYIIFKCNIRNSDIDVSDALNNLIILKYVSGIDQISQIRDFVLEEISNLLKLLESLKEENYYFNFLQKLQNLQSDIYEEDMNGIKKNSFWKHLFEIEDNILNAIRLIGRDDIAKIALLERFNVEFDEKEIFFSVKSQACLALADIFFKTKDPNVAVVLKLMYELDDNVTYKEVYFILLLFGLIDFIKSMNENESFVSNVKKQDEKYAYTMQAVEKKKQYVKNIEKSKKTYVRILSADDYDMKILTKALTKSNFDYIVSGNSIYLNSFYFNELENVKKSLNEKKAYNEF